MKNIQHAEDFTVVLKDELSMKNALDTINSFCRTAGSKINIDQTECILVGDLKNEFEKIFEIKGTKKLSDVQVFIQDTIKKSVTIKTG